MYIDEQAIGLELIRIAADATLTPEEKDEAVEALEAEVERAEQEADPANGCPPRE